MICCICEKLKQDNDILISNLEECQRHNHKEQPKKWTEEDLRKWWCENSSLKHEDSQRWCNNDLFRLFRQIGLLKEEPPKEPEYQWLWKIKISDHWYGITNYKPGKDIEILKKS